MKRCKIHDFSEFPDFQWNAPQKHQEKVAFIKDSGVGPGGARSAQNREKVQTVNHSDKKKPTTYWLSCFHEDFVLFATGARNHGIPIGLLRFPGCHFLQNHRFHGNPGFLWNSRISVKISGLHGNPRFPRKCGSRRKWHLKNVNKCLGISCFSTPATRKAGFPWKTWKSAKMTENTEILKFHQKREKTENRGKPGKRESAEKGGPSPAPPGDPFYYGTVGYTPKPL